MQDTELDSTPVNWPFAFTNGVRNPESQELLDTKQRYVKIKLDPNNEQDALL